MNLNPFAWRARRKAEAAAAARVAAVLTREAVFLELDGFNHFYAGPGVSVNLTAVSAGFTATATFPGRAGTVVGLMIYPDTMEIIRPVYADEL